MPVEGEGDGVHGSFALECYEEDVWGGKGCYGDLVRMVKGM